MKGHKTRFLPTSIYNVAAVETWLSDQAKKGWLLGDGISPSMARLERGTPVDCQYRLEPIGGTALIQDPDIRSYYTESGWEFVCFSRGKDFRVWRSTRSDPMEIHSEPEVEDRAYCRLSRRLYRSCAWMVLWVLGYLYVLYPRPSALQGALERQICEIPGTRLPLLLLVLGYLLVLSFASARAVWRLRKSLKLGIPLDHTRRTRSGWTWGRWIVLAAAALLLVASVLWPSAQMESIQADVPPVLLSADLGGDYENTDGFITTGRSILAKELVWGMETTGSIAETVTETRYYALRLPFLAGPLLAEVAERWDLSDSDRLEDIRFDELYFRRREDRQYLALRQGGQVLYVYARGLESLTDHLDDYAAVLSTF